jgi:hypothetical protein
MVPGVRKCTELTGCGIERFMGRDRVFWDKGEEKGERSRRQDMGEADRDEVR